MAINFGYGNSGDGNSGYGNSGNRNSGNRNSGNRNSGNWNSGNGNSGYFNVDSPFVRMFGRDTSIKDASEIEFPDYMFFDLCVWVNEEEMTEKEKYEHPVCKKVGGYLRVKEYKDAWREAWDGAEGEEKVQTIYLPNFDPDIFLEITGIDVRKERFNGNRYADGNDDSKKQELLKKADELVEKAEELRKKAGEI